MERTAIGNNEIINVSVKKISLLSLQQQRQAPTERQKLKRGKERARWKNRSDETKLREDGEREKMTINILWNSDKKHESTGWFVEWNWFIEKNMAFTIHAHLQHIFGWHLCCVIVWGCVCACIVKQTILRFHLGFLLFTLILRWFEAIETDDMHEFAAFHRNFSYCCYFLLNYVEQYK